MFGVLRNIGSMKILECILCSYVLFLWGQRVGEYLPLWELPGGFARWRLRLTAGAAAGGLSPQHRWMIGPFHSSQSRLGGDLVAVSIYVTLLTDHAEHVCTRLLNTGVSVCLWGLPRGSMVKTLPAMQELQVPFLGCEDPLEESVAAHSSILAHRIPWTDEPYGRKESDTTEVT